MNKGTAKSAIGSGVPKTYKEFSDELMVSIEDICRVFFRENRDIIRIKKENTAVKNLVNIVQTTLKLSNEKGFDAMSLRDLSKESGLSMGALYSYFNSKVELLSLIQYQGQLTVKKILLDYMSRETEPEMKLRALIRIHLYLSEMMKSWFYFFFMETKNLEKKYRQIPIESELMTEQMFIEILTEGIKKKIFREVDLKLTGSSIKALLQDWYLKPWKYSQRKISIEDYTGFVIDMIESYVLRKR